jgi:ABC-type antimicrobial peptide transport system permease subunit
MIPGYVGVAVAPEGFEFAPGQNSVTVVSSSVDPGYFGALGVGIVRGRGFLPTDTLDSPSVVVVDQTFADRYLASDPIGKRLRLVQEGNRTAEVVGVSVPSRHNSVFMPPQPFLYVPFAQRPIPKMTLIAQTEADPANAIAALRDVVRGIDINVPVYRVETMEELFEQRSVAVANLLVGIATTVGLVGLCLALIGLYAIVSYQVSRRTREIGIRMAVGAVRAEVLRMILKQAAVMGIAGVAIGTVLSFAGGRGLTLAMGMPSFDPLLLSVVPIALFTTTVLAALVPARRASSIDPQEALRHD